MQRSRPNGASGRAKPPVVRRAPARSRDEEEADGRRQLVSVCRRMHERGLIAGTSGSVSVRLPGGRLLVTPGGLNSADLVEEDPVLVDVAGQPVKGERRPSSELLMHLLCYEARGDVHAVLHAHPVHAVALAMAGVSLANCILPESCLSLGLILAATRSALGAPGPSGIEEVPRALRDLVARADAVLLDRHGTLTVGQTLAAAYDRLENIEHAGRITHAARCLGEVHPLSERHVEQLREVARRQGWAAIPGGCSECNACPNGHLVAAPADREAISAQIDDAIARFLRS